VEPGTVGRYTSINGQVLPVFRGAVAGRIERWRIVHAGIRDTVKLKFRKMRPGAPDVPSPGALADWVSANCPGEDDVPQFVVAHDGLTRSAIYEQTTTVMQPGYRADLLVAFPESGTYRVIDDDAPASATVSNVARKRRLLGRVEVSPGQPIAGTAREHISAVLLAAAERRIPEPVRAKVVADLGDGPARPLHRHHHRPMTQRRIRLGRKTLEFSIGGGFKIERCALRSQCCPR
jgi:FtsP/CotA-like multicopper oxidase with cupredoxin domain